MLNAYQMQKIKDPLLSSVSSLIPLGHQDYVPHVVDLLKKSRDLILFGPDQSRAIPDELHPHVYRYAIFVFSKIKPSVVLHGVKASIPGVPLDFVYSMYELLSAFIYRRNQVAVADENQERVENNENLDLNEFKKSFKLR